jgi:hypothetical protein
MFLVCESLNKSAAVFASLFFSLSTELRKGTPNQIRRSCKRLTLGRIRLRLFHSDFAGAKDAIFCKNCVADAIAFFAATGKNLSLSLSLSLSLHIRNCTDMCWHVLFRAVPTALNSTF